MAKLNFYELLYIEMAIVQAVTKINMQESLL